MSTILTGQDIHDRRSLARQLTQPHVQAIARRVGVRVPKLDQVSMGTPPLPAEINHGRWIVRCPCGGAENVWPDTPLMFCSSCGNTGRVPGGHPFPAADAGGLLRRVRMPSPLHQERIMRALLEREPEHTNWVPGELIGALRNENLAHGLPAEAAE